MYKDDSSPYCYFHPKEEYVGVCPLCLNERLLVLASKQRSPRTKHSSSSPIISLPKIFTLSSLLSRLDLRHHRKFHPSSDLDVSTSQEGTQLYYTMHVYILHTIYMYFIIYIHVIAINFDIIILQRFNYYKWMFSFLPFFCQSLFLPCFAKVLFFLFFMFIHEKSLFQKMKIQYLFISITRLIIAYIFVQLCTKFRKRR